MSSDSHEGLSTNAHSLNPPFIVDGFICPPMVVIDGSVLTAINLLLAFAILVQLSLLIEVAAGGKTIRLRKGDFSDEVSSGQESFLKHCLLRGLLPMEF